MSARKIDAAVIAEHDALRAKATPGPWHVSGQFDCYVFGEGDDLTAEVWPTPSGGDEKNNATYITTLANDDEAMCRRVEELSREVERLQMKLARSEECGLGLVDPECVLPRGHDGSCKAALDGERP